MQGLFSAFPPPAAPRRSLILLFVPRPRYSSSPLPFLLLASLALTRKSRVHAYVYLRFLSLSLPLLLSSGPSRTRGRHPVAFRLYLSATGRPLVAQPLYIKRQGACYSLRRLLLATHCAGLAPPSRRSATTGISIVRVRGSVTKSIPCRRAAFYLRALPTLLRPLPVHSFPPISSLSFATRAAFRSLLVLVPLRHPPPLSRP